MSKHKKTRQEKIIADLRRQLLQTERIIPLSSPQSVSEESQQYNNSPVRVSSLQTAPYLFSDLLRTSLVTCAIIAGEFTLLFLLKKHLIILPTLSF